MNKNPDIDGQKNLHISAFLLTSLAEGNMFTKPGRSFFLRIPVEGERERKGRQVVASLQIQPDMELINTV